MRKAGLVLNFKGRGSRNMCSHIEIREGRLFGKNFGRQQLPTLHVIMKIKMQLLLIHVNRTEPPDAPRLLNDA